jgi:protein-tyrosine-phosphatase
MAEIIFANLCKANKKRVTVRGAGTHANPGEHMMTEAIRALELCGEKVPAKVHVAARFSPEMISVYDYIITMTKDHARYIGDFPNVYSLGDFSNDGDIADPYLNSQNVYLQTCRQIQVAVRVLYDNIVNNNGGKK